MNLKKKLYRRTKKWVHIFLQQWRRWLWFWIFCPGGVFALLQFHGGFAYMSTTKFNLGWTSFLTWGSSDCKYLEKIEHVPQNLFFRRKSANLSAYFPPDSQYKFGIWESSVIFEYWNISMYFHLWLIDWESNPVLKWDLWLSWAIIHPPRPNSNRINLESETKFNFVMELFFANEPSFVWF